MPSSDKNEGQSTATKEHSKDALGKQPDTSREILVAMVIMASLFLVQLFAEHTDPVEATRIQAFAYFQRLLSNTTDERLPVVVLNITDVPRNEKGVTDRKKLREIVDALHYASATAVGVDVDMSPDQSGFLDRENDPDLFEHWAELSNEMPVIVGVYRTRNLPPERWLGADEFHSLSGFLGTAKTPDGEKVTRMQSHYRSKNSKVEGLPTLGYALSLGYLRMQRESLPKEGSLMSYLVEPVDETDESRLVNFSKVAQVKREAMLNTASAAISGPDAPNYRQKIVLLGDIAPVDLRPDSFFAPGFDRLPGVIYHASTVWTFAFEPVYEFNWWTRTVLDLALGSIFIVAVWARTRFVRGTRAQTRSLLNYIEQYALLVAFVLLILVALVAMRIFHIMWLDSIVVAFGLLVHYLLPQQVKELFPSVFGASERDHEKTSGAAQ